jgi:hypothetical protein
MHNGQYNVNRPKKAPKGKISLEEGGLSESSPLRSDGSRVVRWEAEPRVSGQGPQT